MGKTKERLQIRKKIIKSLRTHLAKRVIFSVNLKSTKGIHNQHSTEEHILIVLSENSKIDLSDANNIIRHFCNVRTYMDLDLICKKTVDGIEIEYRYNKMDYILKFHIFRFSNLSSTKLIGYQINDNVEYTWIDIVDYQKHPSVIEKSNMIHFHRMVTKLIYSNINVVNDIDWTYLIERDKADYVANR